MANSTHFHRCPPNTTTSGGLQGVPLPLPLPLPRHFARCQRHLDCTLRSNKSMLSAPSSLFLLLLLLFSSWPGLISATKQHRVLVVCRRSLRQWTFYIALRIGRAALALNFQFLCQRFYKEKKEKKKTICTLSKYRRNL